MPAARAAPSGAEAAKRLLFLAPVRRLPIFEAFLCSFNDPHCGWSTSLTFSLLRKPQKSCYLTTINIRWPCL